MNALPTLGFLGLGRMGAPLADALETDGYRVRRYDPVTAPENSVAAVARAADVLVTVLPGTPELEHAMADAGPHLRAGATWLDLTSADPRVVEGIAARLTGVTVVGAPMAGGPSAAAERRVHFHVGGQLAPVERILASLGTIEVIGPRVGDGYTAKLLSNLLWFGQVVAVTEALLLGQSLGLDPARLRGTLAAGAGGSAFLEEYVDRLLDGDNAETFGLDRCVEELDALASLAQQQGVPWQLSSVVAQLHRDALERFGPVPGELLAARLLEERAGTTLRRGA